METIEQGKKRISKTGLAVCNILLVLVTVLFMMRYSNDVKASREQLMRENFCNTVETMKQISVRYLSRELDNAASWAAYIEREHMSMAEAMDYIRTVNEQEGGEAHFVDMETFDAWSTRTVNGSNEVDVYRRYNTGKASDTQKYIDRLREIYDGKMCVFGRYKLQETQGNVISVGRRVVLRGEDGSDREYLLLRVMPVERMKELWLFPVSYPSAEIGLIATDGDYVIPSYSMRAENFMEFARAYSFAGDYTGADRELAQLQEQSSGLMQLNNSRGKPCYWYYSRLDTFEGLDILGYIPVDALVSSSDSLSIVAAVAGVCLLLVLLDGAYILNINRELRATADVAWKASRAKTQFLSSMSHDIRTPLNAVLGMTELAQSHMNDPAYVQECLRKISLSGNHLLTLINDILEISRVESGRITLNPAPFDVRELTGGLEGITRSQALGHGLTLDVQFGELPEPCLLGDRLRLTQVYLNLLNNAVKYTAPGGSIRLEMGEERMEDGGVMLVCVVADTGSGMSEEFQKTMYDSFTRVSDSRIDKIQGSGLGLAIVKRMVTLMNGTIDCVSMENIGTTFTVRIPLLAAPAPAHAAQEETDDVPERGGDLTGVRVLVAEDNDINWEIISALLGDYGVRCERAENGRSCVERLHAVPPRTYDLVLMDVQMPVLNGRDAARELRASDREDLRTIPIVAMTADAFAEDVQMCLDAGMDAHVAKPVEIGKVLATIRVLLARKKSGDGRTS